MENRLGLGGAVAAAFGAVATSIALWSPDAEACGCFAQSTVGEPVVQAGERIVFAHQNGKVVAHIQIQYAGSAQDFAWLLPLPSVPVLKLGDEALFAEVEQRTQPTYVLNQTGSGCGGGGPSFGCSSEDSAFSADAGARPKLPNEEQVVVVRSEVGPYDYAVLRADDKAPMLEWLNTNRFFVPQGTEDVVGPYIRPGAYFLALKLKSNQSLGDLQPVVVEYPSDLPMIPIMLTSVAANPDMGILVWVLGQSRAIPRNYQHVEINDEHIDWVNGAKNYGEVVARAIDEAEGHHAFVTEYAGTTTIMLGVLGQKAAVFGERSTLEQLTRASEYLAELARRRFDEKRLLPILREHVEMPAEARQAGYTTTSFYADVDTMASVYARFAPDARLDSMEITAKIWERFVTPLIEADQLFNENPTMTRLYSVLSPEEMTKDPVFSFNPTLPDVSNRHTATMVRDCEDEDLPLSMELPDGRKFRLRDQSEWSSRNKVVVPRARKIEVLREEGPPELIVDNMPLLLAADDEGGCRSFGRTARNGLGQIAFLVLVVAIGRRRMRRRSV